MARQNDRSVTVYLGLGTNKGDRQANLRAVIEDLPPEVTVTAESSVFQTPPWGFTDQPDFLNMVVAGETSLPPLELLSYLKDLEQQVGRTASFRWGPREIDIDILDYGGLVLDLEGLTLPHPRMEARGFVLVPLAEVAPEWVHPRLGVSIQELLAEIDTGEIEIYPGELT